MYPKLLVLWKITSKAKTKYESQMINLLFIITRNTQMVHLPVE